METLILAIILILIVLYIVVWFLATDRFYRKWEAEYAEMKRRKEEILQKRSLAQPYHCPYCGEVIPPASSDYADCPKCGGVVMTKQEDRDGPAGKSPYGRKGDSQIVKCPKCGTENPRQARKLTKCGFELTPVDRVGSRWDTICPWCLHRNPWWAIRCRFCGKKPGGYA